jgi:hypothetical protein
VGIEPELGVDAVGRNPSNAARSGKELEGETWDRRGEGRGREARARRKKNSPLLFWLIGVTAD